MILWPDSPGNQTQDLTHVRYALRSCVKPWVLKDYCTHLIYLLNVGCLISVSFFYFFIMEKHRTLHVTEDPIFYTLH